MSFLKANIRIFYPLLLILAIVLGIIGFHEHASINRASRDLLSSLYLSLQLFLMNSGAVEGYIPISLQVARFLAPALTIGGIYLAMIDTFQEQWNFLKIRFFYSGHVIVCGLSKKAELLINDFLNENYKVVVIEINSKHDGIQAVKRKGIIVIKGNAEDENILLKAGVLKALYVLALTDKEEANIKIAKKISFVFESYPPQIIPGNLQTIILHISDYYSMQMFKEYHEAKVPSFTKGDTKVDFHAFSIYQIAGAYLADTYSPDQFISVKKESDPQVHIVVFGLGLAGQHFLIEAANMYHFANLKKLKVSIIDNDIKNKSEALKSIHPFLAQVITIDFLEQSDLLINPSSFKCDDVSGCFICLNDDGESIHYAKKMRQIFFNSKNKKDELIREFKNDKDFKKYSDPPIVVLLPRKTSVYNLFDNIVKLAEELNIHLVEIDKHICNKKIIVDNHREDDDIAEFIHNEYSKTAEQKLQWKDLKDSEKDSNRLPARHLKIKLRFIDAEFADEKTEKREIEFNELSLEEKLLIQKMEHRRWLAEKQINGFIKSERINNDALQKFIKKELNCHTDLIPYNDLPLQTQEKDFATFNMTPEIARKHKKKIISK